MQNQSSFEQQFFKYTLPVPFHSQYTLQYAKSNDMRLLLEMATRSHLRMFTDPKTSNLHFVCKHHGEDCLDLQAILSQEGDTFYFYENCSLLVHRRSGCQQKGVNQMFLKIYNLLKLKRELIQEFMKEKGLVKESPREILNGLSWGDRGHYFFEKHINYNQEMRRKLRKRFDNVVNIDIKKIGKHHSEPLSQQKQEVIFFEEGLEMQQERPETKLGKEEGEISSSKTNQKTRGIIKVKRKKMLQKKKTKRVQDQKMTEVRQSIFILPEDSSYKGEEIFIEPSADCQLPELKVLQQHADYLWSSSQSPSQPSQKELPEVLQISREDYFQSLRNSALKRSLEKESLCSQIFHFEPVKQQ